MIIDKSALETHASPLRGLASLTPMRYPEIAADVVDKIIYLACLLLSIELVLFKFLPDIANAAIQGDRSVLADFTLFEQIYLRPGSVHHARFLGNDIHYLLARSIAKWVGSADIRLHPLRIAAGLLTALYASIGALPVLLGIGAYSWRAFFIPYVLVVLMSLYAFSPCDMPALAFLSVGLFFLLQERLLLALGLMLIVGLFRETSFHLVWFVFAWAMCAHSATTIRKVSWTVAFALAFVVEYWAIRQYYPGPISSSGGLILDPRQLFLGNGIFSLTTLCSLSLAAMFPILCWRKLRPLPGAAWQTRFFLLNCAVFPLWIVFYRMLSGNMSEFRLLLPVIIPCLYGFSFAYGAAGSEVRVRQRNGVPI